MAEKTKSAPWVWIGCGCAASLLAVGVVLGGLGYLGFRQVKKLEADMQNPEIRAERAREVLGTDRLPEGYHPVIAMSIPFLMDMAILSDIEAESDLDNHPGFDQRGFIYMQILRGGRQQKELEEFFEGTRDDAEALRNSSIRFRRGELIKRGEVALADMSVRFAAQRAEVDFADGGDSGSSIATVLLIDCPQDERMRMGIWFEPDPQPERATAELDLRGTPADEAALKEFIGHFRLC